MFTALFLTVALSANPNCTCKDCPCVACKCVDCGKGCKCPLPADYLAVEKRVAKGEELIVYAGVPLPTKAAKNAVRIAKFPTEPNGVYRCYFDAKTKETKYVPISTVKPAAAKPVEYFPLQSILPSRENCPNGNCPNVRPARGGLGFFR